QKSVATKLGRLIFTHEASFRQVSTLHTNWSQVDCPPEVPVTGRRKTVKIFGAIELWKTRVHYPQETICNASTYFAFLEQLARSYRRQGALLRTIRHSTETATYGLGSIQSPRAGSSSVPALVTGAESHRAIMGDTHAKQGIIMDTFRRRRN